MGVKKGELPDGSKLVRLNFLCGLMPQINLFATDALFG